jgi:predicted O-methyltransferase YrrM
MTHVPPEIFVERDDPCHPYIRSENYYEHYYAIAKLFRPRSILEIGVRLGYSLSSMAAGSDIVDYIEGWDNGSYMPMWREYAERALALVTGKMAIGVNLLMQNSQAITKLLRSFDLIHIDGDHSMAGALHDMELCSGHFKVLVVDDYTFPEVKTACDEFVTRHRAELTEHFIIPSHQGTFVALGVSCRCES